MTVIRTAMSIASLHRKLKAIAALHRDPAATPAERANAETLTGRLTAQLDDAAQRDGTAFRLGQKVKEIKDATAPPAPKGDWTDNAFRLGRAFRRGLKK